MKGKWKLCGLAVATVLLLMAVLVGIPALATQMADAQQIVMNTPAEIGPGMSIAAANDDAIKRTDVTPVAMNTMIGSTLTTAANIPVTTATPAAMAKSNGGPALADEIVLATASLSLGTAKNQAKFTPNTC